MTSTLVVGGCSFTQDYQISTWPYYLARAFNWNLVNTAARGAGMDFVSKRLMVELSNHEPAKTQVVIMLPSADRFDLYIDQTNPMFDDMLSVSSWQGNQYPELVNLDGTKSVTKGYSLTGARPRAIKQYYYKYLYSDTQSTVNFWFRVIAIQNYLKVKNFSYYITMVHNVDDLKEGQEFNTAVDGATDLLKLIDWDRFVFYNQHQGFLDFFHDKNFGTIDGYHANTAAHQAWTEQILLPLYSDYDNQTG
jgi:hypothetical protein